MLGCGAIGLLIIAGLGAQMNIEPLIAGASVGRDTLEALRV